MLRLEKRPSDSRLMAYLSPVMAILLTLFSGALLFAFLGQSPTHALYTFFVSPLSDLYGWSELGVKVAPLMLCALGLTLCFRAKVWNIGAEGQFIIGGLGGGYLALQMGDIESAWVLPAVILFGALCGLGWAAVAALLKTRFNCNEVLTTIMLNYIALNALLYAVHGPLKDPEGFNFPESALFSDYATLPSMFEDYRVSISLGFALILLAVIWTLLSRTMIGFQISVLGEDAKAAQFAGFRAKRLVWLTLLLCGALAGFAGVSEVTGQIGQLTPYISPGYGYSAIIVVFLGRMHPVGILLGSMLLGLTFLGGEMVQMEMSMPKSITGLFQGMLLFYLLACDLFIGYRIKLKSSAAKAVTAGS
ncbi:sugar ABC transporter permease [Hahella sp. CCB-MM4]|uniref:ABC transporter permease n=1 Tax=Hahella sp. (strain CCB-MM4) TaxID=1926491 RepID=UPI000B9B1708|nr:ABC transporter permease [Hahella sp. CCB-MM4]OZG70256.1 sugar ABC transporter permease [Hahella sp. CCB-MM4]